LNTNGYKISKIAAIDSKHISQLVRDVAQKDTTNNHVLSAFKLSMINFDQKLFYDTYANLEKEKSFTEIFYQDIIPLLTEIGMLWQTDTITPAHEHFATTLIRQKILINTEQIQSQNQIKSKKVFVLYLPENEVHELGLMMINYEIISKGHQCIYLGQSVPASSLKDILDFYDDITFVSYFTVKPEKDHIDNYIADFSKKLLINENIRLWVLGRMLDVADHSKFSKQITTFDMIKDLVKKL